MNNEKTHSAIKSKTFKRLNHITNQLYKIDFVKPEIEHGEPIMLDFFLQYVKQRMLELIYSFFKNFCDTDQYEELELDTRSIYLVLSGGNLYHVILPKKRDQWKAMRFRDCTDALTANAADTFFSRMCSNTHNKHNKRELVLFREEFRCSKMQCLCCKTYCCCNRKSNKYKVSSNGLTNRTLEDSGDGLKSKYRKMLDESFHVTSTIREF